MRNDFRRNDGGGNNKDVMEKKKRKNEKNGRGRRIGIKKLKIKDEKNEIREKKRR